MNLEAEKLEIMKMILETENPGIIKSIKTLLWKEDNSDFWETLTQSEKEDIKQGLKDIEAGDVVNYDEFIEKFR